MLGIRVGRHVGKVLLRNDIYGQASFKGVKVISDVAIKNNLYLGWNDLLINTKQEGATCSSPQTVLHRLLRLAKFIEFVERHHKKL